MRKKAVFVSLAALIALAGCGSSNKKSSGTPGTTAPSSARPHIDVDATEFAFVAPAQVPSGWVDVTLHNKGKQDHQMGIVKLGSLTFEQFKTRASTNNLNGIPAGTIFAGGPNDVGPGQSVTVTVHLDPGTYEIACFLPDFTGDQKPHAAHGMVAQFTAAPTAQSVEQPPAADGGTIQLSEFTFVVPNGFKGQGTVKVDNVGTQVHEMIVYAIAPGKTFDDVKNYVIGGATGKTPSGPPPFENAPGVVAVGARQTNYVNLSLAPGKYALMCFLPDTSVKNGLPHALKGMAQEVDIS